MTRSAPGRPHREQAPLLPFRFGIFYKEFTPPYHLSYKEILQFLHHTEGDNMQPTSKKIFLFTYVLVFLLSACKANIARNQDGSLTVETTIGQQELQDVVSAAIADPLVKNITVSLQSGYVSVSGERQRLNDASKTDMLTFRLDLSVNNGQLISSISNAQLDGKPLEQNRVDNWNQTIANRLSNLGQRNQNSTLQSISITTEAATMIWTVTK